MDYENQQMLENMFNARQTKKLLRKELVASPEVLARITRSELDEEFCLDLLSQMILAKRADVTSLVGQLKCHFSFSENPYQACADALKHAAVMDLVNYDCNRHQFVVIFDADETTMQLIRQYMYMPPMTVPPLPIQDDGNNRGSGYTTVRTDSLLLQDNHHNGDLCIDSLNRFNQIPLSINDRIVKNIRNNWKGIDKPKSDEDFQAYRERVKAFERYEKDSFFTMALMMEMGNRFYLTHKVDKRGRTYCQGYHINPQGNVYNKACVELADKELVQ